MQIKHRKRRYAAQIGGLFIALAVIGVMTVILLCLRLTFMALDNSSEKKMFGDIVLPVVMFNPPPFEKATDIEMPSLLMYSMWSTLLSEKGKSYQYAETTGELMVPASDLDVAAVKLFGPDVKLQHQSFGEFDNTYFYDESNAMYNVPNAAQYNVYTPFVEEINKKDGFLELRVGYIPSGITFQTDFSGGAGQAAPEKYMNYIMQKTKNGYYIAKLQDPVISYVLPPPDQAGGAQGAPSASAPESALPASGAGFASSQSEAASTEEEPSSSQEESSSEGESSSDGDTSSSEGESSSGAESSPSGRAPDSADGTAESE